MAHYRVGEHLYDMDPTTWPNVDVATVQRQLGVGLSRFMEMLEGMDVNAVQAMIHVLRRRDEPGLRVDDVTFTIREYLDAIELTDTDIRDTWPILEVGQKPAFLASLTDDQRERLFVDGELVTVPVPLDGTSGEGSET